MKEGVIGGFEVLKMMSIIDHMLLEKQCFAPSSALLVKKIETCSLETVESGYVHLAFVH